MTSDKMQSSLASRGPQGEAELPAPSGRWRSSRSTSWGVTYGSPASGTGGSHGWPAAALRAVIASTSCGGSWTVG